MSSTSERPSWLSDILTTDKVSSKEDALKLVVQMAVASAENGGGPFAALLVDTDNSVLSFGWNRVVMSHDSTAHAEIDCIRRAQSKFKTHNLRTLGHTTIYSNSAPCIQCYGAIWWSGVCSVVSASKTELVERAGFAEGPVSDQLWNIAKEEKNIDFEVVHASGIDSNAPFLAYKNKGGIVY